MNTVILYRPAESETWAVLPGTYTDFQHAADMVNFIRYSCPATALFAIEHSDDVSRKGYATN